MPQSESPSEKVHDYREAVRAFNQFLRDAAHDASGTTPEIMRKELGDLAFLFLGEKAAVSDGHSEYIWPQQACEQAGLKVHKKFVYSPKKVDEVREGHPDVFADLPKDHEELFEYIEREWDTVPMGLLLGYPKTSVLQFAAMNPDAPNPHAEFPEVYGMSWRDETPNEQSRERQRELKVAFEKSGIQSVIDHHQPTLPYRIGRMVGKGIRKLLG